MQVYLDNSATTKVTKHVKDIVIKVMEEDYGNPSSLHLKGVESEKYIKRSKEIISGILKTDEKEILFTSGGTESNNQAIIGAATANCRKGKHLITSSIEHPSVLNAMKYLEEQGFRVTYLPVDSNGIIVLEELKSAICDETILVSIMHVNNEIGSVQPIDKAVPMIRNQKPDILIHVDAIQSFGKFRIYPKRQGIDLLSVSGHKLHGPKGVGLLYIKDKTKIKPLIYGGDQQKGLRSGTENVPGIAGIGQAAKEMYEDFDERVSKLRDLKDYFIDHIMELDGVSVNSQKGIKGAPHIISVTFEGVRSEVFLHALEEKNIFISAGSACASNRNRHATSTTLKAIGMNEEMSNSTVRFSLGAFTTKKELEYTISVIAERLEGLRLYRRKK